MNALNQLWNFGTAHWGVFVTLSGAIVSHWGTVGGLYGLKNFFLTGKISPDVPKQEPQQKTQ